MREGLNLFMHVLLLRLLLSFKFGVCLCVFRTATSSMVMAPYSGLGMH